jgi:Meckel syndrome type 1 protein
MFPFPRSVLLLATVLLSACAAQGDFPSLAPRAAERGLAGGSAPAPCLAPDQTRETRVAQAPSPLPADPALRARVAELLGAARAAQTEFASILPGAERAVARAGATGSEAWVAAQQEVSRLATARARTADALSELDSLGIRRSAERTINSEDYDAILQAESEARTLTERQEAELNRLSGRLSAP